MNSDQRYYDFLDKLSESEACMYSVSPLLKKRFRSLTARKANDIVLSWIKKNGYFKKYIKKQRHLSSAW